MTSDLPTPDSEVDKGLFESAVMVENPDDYSSHGTGNGPQEDVTSVNPSPESSDADPPLYKVKELWIYPIKGCSGIQVDTAKMTPEGLLGDRQWIFVDRNGVAITTEQEPRLKRVESRFVNNGEEVELQNSDPYLGHPAIRLPTLPSTRWKNESHPKLLPVWIAGVHTMATACEIPQDDLLFQSAQNLCLSLFSPRICGARLVYKFGTRHVRVHDKLGCRGSNLSNSYPIKLITQESLKHLNWFIDEKENEKEERLKRIPGAARRTKKMRENKWASAKRFRPNIVVDGDVPWGEDDWKRVRLTYSGLTLDIAETAEHGHDDGSVVWRYLAELRGIDENDEDTELPTFGVLASPRANDTAGSRGVQMAVGDEMEVVELIDPSSSDC